jgi:hypothetical protein
MLQRWPLFQLIVDQVTQQMKVSMIHQRYDDLGNDSIDDLQTEKTGPKNRQLQCRLIFFITAMGKLENH